MFWAVVVMFIAICSYIWLVRPRLIKFLLFSSVLPVLMFFVSLVPAVRSSETGPTWLIFLIFLAIWIIPFMGFLHAGYKSMMLGGGLARKAVIKSNLADNSTLLLLRCFALDNTLVKRSTHIIGTLDIFRLFLIRLEEVIVREAFLKAPVVAVANPKDRQEPLGAVREYLSDADWQPFVFDKIADSQAIIFILGRGNYTGWETQQILESDAVDRVIFIVPPNPQPAIDYLDQNPQVRALIGGDAGMRLIGTRRVRGFITNPESTVFVTSHFSSELSYTLAMRRLLSLVTEEGFLNGTR